MSIEKGCFDPRFWRSGTFRFPKIGYLLRSVIYIGLPLCIDHEHEHEA